MKQKAKFWLMLLTITMIAATAAFATTGKNCVEFYGTVTYDGAGAVPGGTVYALEAAPPGGRSARTYSAAIASNGTYSLMVDHKGTYILEVEGPTFTGEYYMDASTQAAATRFDATCGTAYQVNFSVAGANPTPTIHFTTEPPFEWDPNVPFVYDADATASNNGAVLFKEDLLPAGATLDPNTGVVQYTYSTSHPTGYVSFSITAYLASDPTIEATQAWVTQFEQKPIFPEDCVLFEGTVKDENGNPVTSGTVTAASVPQGGGIGPTVTGDIDLNGAYSFYVPAPGPYKLHVEGTGFVDEWYDNAPDEASATQIDTECGNVVTTDFVVATSTTYQNSISGQVYGNNKTVSCTIEAYKVVFGGGGVFIDKQTMANTDANGNFSIANVSPGDYVLKAVNVPKQYVPGFYLQTGEAVADWPNATQLSIGSYSVVQGLEFVLAKDRGKPKAGYAAVTTPEFTAHPNPASGIVHVQVGNAERTLTVTLYTSLGTEIARRVVSADARTTGVSFDVSPLRTGTYYITVSGSENTSTIPLSIVR